MPSLTSACEWNYRIDLMNITGQTEDNKLQFSKTGELILSQQAFGQALSTMQEVMLEIKNVSCRR